MLARQRMLKTNSVILCLALCTLSLGSNACSPHNTESEATATVSSPVKSPYLGKITTESQFDAMGTAGAGLLRTGKNLKFFINLSDKSKPQLYFLNGNYPSPEKVPENLKYHFMFATQRLGIGISNQDFEEKTYFTNEKTFVAGNLQSYRLEEGKPTLYGIQLFPSDVAHGNTLTQIAKVIRNGLGFKASLAFVATGPQQKIEDAGPSLQNIGVEYTTIDALLGKVAYIPMNTGSAYGYLRTKPKMDQLTPVDIPVFNELPLDLAVVAGTITSAFQDTNSHINLKSKERKTPNMVLRDAGPDHPALKDFEGKPVHLIVKDEGFVLEAATVEQVERAQKDKASRPWIQMKSLLDTPLKKQTLLKFDSMCNLNAAECLAASSAYGSKAANLGFLAHRTVLGRKETPNTLSNKFGYDLSPVGFGVPLQFYVDFINYPANSALLAALKSYSAAEMAGTVGLEARAQKIGEIKELFYTATFPPERLSELKAAWEQILPGIKKIKVRSSANAEDISGFNGAGLYDSFSAKSDSQDKDNGACKFEVDEEGEDSAVKGKMKPRTIQCAIKGVYASLWNKRAVEERNFAHIDHLSSNMGLAVLPVYDTLVPVVANSVVVTRILNSNQLYGYTVSTQVGENTVTNPQPGTVSETTLINYIGDGRQPTYTTLRFAKPEVASPARTSTILGNHMTQLFEISRTVEKAYCLAVPSYYPGAGRNKCDFVIVDNKKPRSLDMEFKLVGGNLDALPGSADAPQFICKQVREFSGN